jgi:hypothetical protein
MSLLITLCLLAAVAAHPFKQESGIRNIQIITCNEQVKLYTIDVAFSGASTTSNSAARKYVNQVFGRPDFSSYSDRKLSAVVYNLLREKLTPQTLIVDINSQIYEESPQITMKNENGRVTTGFLDLKLIKISTYNATSNRYTAIYPVYFVMSLWWAHDDRIDAHKVVTELKTNFELGSATTANTLVTSMREFLKARFNMHSPSFSIRREYNLQRVGANGFSILNDYELSDVAYWMH